MCLVTLDWLMGQLTLNIKVFVTSCRWTPTAAVSSAPTKHFAGKQKVHATTVVVNATIISPAWQHKVPQCQIEIPTFAVQDIQYTPTICVCHIPPLILFFHGHWWPAMHGYSWLMVTLSEGTLMNHQHCSYQWPLFFSRNYPWLSHFYYWSPMVFDSQPLHCWVT